MENVQCIPSFYNMDQRRFHEANSGLYKNECLVLIQGMALREILYPTWGKKELQLKLSPFSGALGFQELMYGGHLSPLLTNYCSESTSF